MFLLARIANLGFVSLLARTQAVDFTSAMARIIFLGFALFLARMPSVVFIDGVARTSRLGFTSRLARNLSLGFIMDMARAVLMGFSKELAQSSNTTFLFPVILCASPSEATKTSTRFFHFSCIKSSIVRSPIPLIQTFFPNVQPD